MSAPVMDNVAQMEDPVILFGAKQALFSTYQGEIRTIMDVNKANIGQCGRRAHRKAPSTPHTPAVVYSDVVRAAVDIANYWREKLPRVAYSVFPDGAWEIEDLWDAEDIHIYTPRLCREALQFLGQDTKWTLNRFAEDWARAHLGDLAATVGRKSMADIYDPTQPMVVLDKIFKYGEHNLFPQQFLHRAATLLRTTMLADEERKMSQVAIDSFTSPPITSKQPDKRQESVKPPSTSKKNRKQDHTRPKRLIVPTESAVRPYHPQEHTMPYGENVAMSRGPSGPLPPLHAAPISHVAIPLGHVPIVHPVNLQHPGPMHASMTNPQCIHPAPPTRGVSMGDMTNAPYYPNGSRAQYVIDPSRTSRRDKPYGNTLYDPYNGAKPAFNEFGATGRKSSRTGFTDQPSRKTSAQGPRARVGSGGNDWGESASNSNRFLDHRSMRHNMKDDPIITNDPLRGCHHNWIGPENNNVTELFIGDLPENIQAQEVEAMFLRLVNIKPTRVTLRPSMSSPRPHAFVTFDSASQAKLALGANHGNPQMRGVHLRVTVPRRFYQKSDDHTAPPQRVVPANSKPADTTIANASAGSSTRPLYTSQDARSDLQKEAIAIPISVAAPAPLPKTSEARKEVDAVHVSPEPKTEVPKVAGSDNEPSLGQNIKVSEVATTARETCPEPETEVEKAVDDAKESSAELKVEDEPSVSEIAKQTTSPEQPCPLAPENFEEAVAMTPVEDHDVQKVGAAEQHIGSANAVSRSPPPQRTASGAHARVVLQTEDAEGVAADQAVQAVVVKVPELSKAESTSMKHEDSAEPVAESVASAEATAPLTAAIVLPGLKVDQDDPHAPTEAAKSPSHVEAAKQHGPSQTQSLNPFAKINKSKREKNKKSKKKEQKQGHKQEDKQEQKLESKTAPADVEQATSIQEMVAPPSVGVPEEAQVKVINTSAPEKFSESPEADITLETQNPLAITKEPVEPLLEPDDVSIGSSTTLQPNTDVQLTPPSPVADEFHTPLQTPTAFSAPQQDESAKPNKKKKNKNKKKKKAATAAEQTSDGIAQAAAAGGSTADVASQPTSFSRPPVDHAQMHYDIMNSFTGQMSYIDDVRAATKDPTTYYSQVNVEMEEERRAQNRR